MITRKRRNTGAIFLYAMWVVIVVAAMVLLLGRSMRVSAIASANRLSTAQAEAAERGVEQYIIGKVASEISVPGSTKNWPVSKFRIGDCYAWLLKPDRDDETTQSFGLTDEAGKLDLNTFNTAQFLNLPGITQEMADSILDWRQGTAVTSANSGADDNYYLSKPEPYRCKHAPLESLEELFLIKGFDPQILYGADRNRDGCLSTRELPSNFQQAAISATGYVSHRGLYPFVTVYGLKAIGPRKENAVDQLIDVNAAEVSALKQCLEQIVGASDGDRILAATQQKQPFRNIFDWAYRTRMTQDELSRMFSRVTIYDSPRHAKININEASIPVLNCLPHLQQSDINAIVAHRDSVGSDDNSADISWLFSTMSKPLLSVMGAYLTGRSYCFSADIVAIAGDGRAFKRYRVVIDGSMNRPAIIYRQELTQLGWPLPLNIRTDLRSGLVLDNSN